MRAALRCSSFSDCSSWGFELDVTRGMQRKWVRGGRLGSLWIGGMRPMLALAGLFT